MNYINIIKNSIWNFRVFNFIYNSPTRSFIICFFNQSNIYHTSDIVIGCSTKLLSPFSIACLLKDLQSLSMLYWALKIASNMPHKSRGFEFERMKIFKCILHNTIYCLLLLFKWASHYCYNRALSNLKWIIDYSQFRYQQQAKFCYANFWSDYI